MRLTLRTLLAYLDKTLDAESSDTLRGKIEESTFASQLVQRIRASVAAPTLAAPSPEAAGPIDDPNVISEYLDSTLPNEQVAEIERACLEYEPLLAEAAGCHQILTRILGQPAEVSQELRDRVYGLPETQSQVPGLGIASGESFSSISMADEPIPALGNIAPNAGGSEDAARSKGHRPLTPNSPQPVRPVGPGDSGVSDAPTRIRKSGMDQQPATASAAHGAAIAGSRPRGKGPTEIYADPVRPMRIAPWLVSFALAGVLLFALGKIFMPLLESRLTSADRGRPPSDLSIAGERPAATGAEIEVSATDAPPMVDIGNSAVDMSSKPAAIEAGELLPEPVTSNDKPVGATAIVPDASAGNLPVNSETKNPEGPSPVPVSSPTAVPMPAEKQLNGPDASVAATDSRATDSPAPGPVADGAVNADAPILATDNTLLLAQTPNGQWLRVASGGAIPPDAKLILPPTFRAQVKSLDGLNITLVGSIQLTHTRDEAGVILEVAGGKMLVRTSTPDVPARLLLSGQSLTAKLSTPQTVLAIDLTHARAPGADPLDESSHARRVNVLVIQGAAELASSGKTAKLETGQQWLLIEGSEPTQLAVKEIPDWIDEPDPAETSLASLARSGLLGLISEQQPVELSLREAVSFRRAEVGALAAEALLTMGRADVYFGGDGVLNNAKQKAYWDEHLVALLKQIDQSVESAEQIRSAVGQMESADGDQLFELLVGYSQDQLKAGADAKLVSLLDAPTMAMRVLALHNLKQITGTTLNYRADQDNPIRRAAEQKKWEIRVRKEDIRWPETAPET